MKKILYLLFLIIISCANVENLSNSANLIAEYCGSSNVSVGTSIYNDTESNEVKTLNIKIKNVEQINNGEYPAKYIASYSAKILNDNLDKNEFKDFDLIDVSIETPNETFEYQYSLNDINKIDSYFNTSKEFILSLKNSDYNRMYKLIDPNEINFEDFKANIVDDFLKKNDSLFNKIELIKLQGFSIIKNDEEEVIELVTLATIPNDYLTIYTRFTIQSNQKIAGFEIN